MEEQDYEDSDTENYSLSICWKALSILKQVAAVAYQTAKSELKVYTDVFKVSYNATKDSIIHLSNNWGHQYD